MTGKMIIRDRDSLRRWHSGVHAAFLVSDLPPAEFSLAGIGEAANRQLTREAARLRRACGCTIAGFAMTVAFLASGIAIALDPRRLADLPLTSWAGYLGLIVIATAAGKLTGLLWARRQMLLLADEAEVLIAAQ